VDGGHALAQRSRGDGGHVDILAVRNVNETFQDLQFYFGLVQFEKLEFFQQDADFLGNLGDGLISEARAMSKSEGTARTSLSEMGVFFESYYLREIAILGWNCSFDEVMIQVYGGSQKKEY
jgi:hypothetical protein